MGWRDRLREASANCYPSANCAVSANSRERELPEGAIGTIGTIGIEIFPAKAPAETAEALARSTLDRVHAALAGYPADDVGRAEREAIEAEGGGELAARGLPDMPPLRARGATGKSSEIKNQSPATAAGEPDPEVAAHLAMLSPAVTAAFTSRPDGRVEVRHRLVGGGWSAPTLIPPLAAAGRAA